MEQKFRILFTEDCGLDTASFARILPQLHVTAALIKSAKADIAGHLREKAIDGIVLNAEDFDLAATLASQEFSAVLLLAEGERLAELYPACIMSGLLVADRSKPADSIPQLLATCTRLRTVRLREHHLQKKLDDTRLVSRAKLLLMDRLQMTEAQAHRYIEKTAMDSGAPRRDVAIGIIRTYEV